MQTFDQHLADLVFESVITHKTGAAAATDADEFEAHLKELRKQARGTKGRKGGEAESEDEEE
jgi:Tfp pilus assembly ATPase PilU